MPKKVYVNEALKRRMELAFEASDGMTDAEVARRVTELVEDPDVQERGVTQQAIQKIHQGKVKSTSYIPHIAHVLGVSAIWLASGVGEMQPKAERFAKHHVGLLNRYKSLPKNSRFIVRQLIETFDSLYHPEKEEKIKANITKAQAKVRKKVRS